MVNRPFVSRLCKTFLTVCCLAAAASTAHGQAIADPAAQHATPASFGLPAEKLKLAGVSNAGKVSEVLLRGAQPSAQGLAELKKLGVTTIVDLRVNGGPVAWERAQAESLGISFVSIPVRGWSPPADAQVAQFLKLVQEDPTQKIFVHCHYGEDRTGVMVATYRIARQNWTSEQAAAEMNSFGFHYHLYQSMKSYVRRFPAKFAVDPVFASLRTLPAQR